MITVILKKDGNTNGYKVNPHKARRMQQTYSRLGFEIIMLYGNKIK